MVTERLLDYFRFTVSGQPIDWKVNRFPDGQIQFCYRAPSPPVANGHVRIVACLRDSECVDLLNQACSVFGWANLEIVITYLYGARSDKDESGDWTVANVARHALKSLASYDGVTIVAPHCDELVATFGYRTCWPIHRDLIDNKPAFDQVVFPDASAARRFSEPFGHLPHVVCEKHRDQASGDIIEHRIPEMTGNAFLVVDDLCDGGRTFLSIGEAARNQGGTFLGLYVTHGVFSGGAIDKLRRYYDAIWITNSLPTVPKDAGLNVLDVWETG